MVFGMLWSAGLVLRTCAYKWISAMKRSTPGSGGEDYFKTALGMKNNCYINVKVLFENVCVHVRVRVRVRPYPPFPTTRCVLSFVNETCPYKESSNFLGCAWLC